MNHWPFLQRKIRKLILLEEDEEGFWRAQAAERKAAGVPPYGRMAGIIVNKILIKILAKLQD